LHEVSFALGALPMRDSDLSPGAIPLDEITETSALYQILASLGKWGGNVLYFEEVYLVLDLAIPYVSSTPTWI